ncbi:Crp/Fnr family transcriptional regulator [bacterium SCSIO 12741]|nr:Crp/Fnr family transcriptional regulator [bacterium SCSIO 12741]
MDLKISDSILPNLALSREEAQLVDRCIPIKSFKAGEVLLREGQIARNCYFVIQGCVRSYHIVNGEERTTGFYLEEDSIAPLASYLSQTPAHHFLTCVEDSVLAVLHFDRERELYQKLPKMEALCRTSMEEEYAKQQDLLQNYLTKTPEERYLLLQKNRPELLQRIPQYHLATYLGVKPESLSRIRKRIAQKGHKSD